MSATGTQILNNPVETRKKLIGIANNVKRNSVARAFSANSVILSTEKEVRDTKQVNVLMPFLQGVKQVSAVLDEALAGAVSASKPQVGERVLTLANELITEPLMWRPRDGEVLQASALLERYKSGFETVATVIFDRNYFKTIGVRAVAGLSTGEKCEVINTDTTLNDITKTLEEQGKLFAQQIREAHVRILQHTDATIQGDFADTSFILGLSPKANLAIKNDAKYNIRTDVAVNDGNQLKLADAYFDGSIETHVSKTFSEENMDGILMIKGVATSTFLFKDFMNMDKVGGVNAYKLSLEFNEGTGVWVPQLITIFAKSADFTAQAAIGSGTLDLMNGVAQATTTSQNPTITTTNAKVGN